MVLQQVETLTPNRSTVMRPRPLKKRMCSRRCRRWTSTCRGGYLQVFDWLQIVVIDWLPAHHLNYLALIQYREVSKKLPLRVLIKDAVPRPLQMLHPKNAQ